MAISQLARHGDGVQQTLFDLTLEDASDDCGADQEGEDYCRLGRYAEFMVCAELTMLGYHAIHADAPGFDIVLTTECAAVLVQVKSSGAVLDGRYHWRTRQSVDAVRGAGCRKRPVTRADADILALYQRDEGKALYLPVVGASRIILSSAQFRSTDPAMSLKSALEAL